MRTLSFFLLLITLSLLGCSAKQLETQASKVQLVYEKPEGNCRKIADVIGTQGNWLSGTYTSNKDLAQGALNDIRNQAAALGGTHVWIHNHDMNVQVLITTNSTVTGTVYACE